MTFTRTDKADRFDSGSYESDDGVFLITQNKKRWLLWDRTRVDSFGMFHHVGGGTLAQCKNKARLYAGNPTRDQDNG